MPDGAAARVVIDDADHDQRLRTHAFSHGDHPPLAPVVSTAGLVVTGGPRVRTVQLAFALLTWWAVTGGERQ